MHLVEHFHEWKEENNIGYKITISKRKKDLYGTVGVEERYYLLQGYSIFMFSIKLETKNINGVM